MSHFSLQAAKDQVARRAAHKASLVKALDQQASAAAASADKGIKAHHVAIGVGALTLAYLIFKKK